MKILTAAMTAVLLFVIAPVAGAQSIELTPFIGYRVGGSLTDYYTGTSYNLDDSESYGLYLNYAPDPADELQFELYWSHQDTTLDITGYQGGDYDTTIDYYHVGGLRFFSDDEKLRPYVAGSVGATHLSPKDSTVGSDTRFSLGVGLGVKIMPSEHIGIRLEARGLATFVSSYGAISCGYPGCAVSFGGSVFWQGDFTAGVVIAF